MNHTPEPWRLAPINPNNTRTEISGTGWSSFATVVTKMLGKDDLSDKGVANAERIIACVNAMAGIEDPKQFVKLAEAHRQQVIAWEKMMMEILGEDGLGSVRQAIEKLKRDADKNSQNVDALHAITETDRDNLCDMLWWLKGYKKGADDNFENCAFQECHMDSLSKVVNSLREILNSKKS